MDAYIYDKTKGLKLTKSEDICYIRMYDSREQGNKNDKYYRLIPTRNSVIPERAVNFENHFFEPRINYEAKTKGDEKQ